MNRHPKARQAASRCPECGILVHGGQQRQDWHREWHRAEDARAERRRSTRKALFQSVGGDMAGAGTVPGVGGRKPRVGSVSAPSGINAEAA